MKKYFRFGNLKFIIAFLIPLIFAMLVTNYLDTDSWYVLAEGKQITENGIYYTDQLSIHEDLSITVQNYGFAVLFYWVFSIFGGVGVYLMMLILLFVVCFLLYKICMVISNKNVNLSLIVMMATSLTLAFGGFVVTRAQMVSYVLFLSLIYVLELYTKTDNKKYLWWLPLLSLLQVNLHASLWPMLIVVTLVYIVDGIKNPKLHLQGYKIKPIVIIGIVMLLVGFLNPYGIKMLLLMFSSYGDARLMASVMELQPFNLRNLPKVILYFTIVATIVLQIIGGDRKRVRIRYLLLFFGFLALGLNSIKGMSQFILVMFLPLASMYQELKIKIIEKKKIRNIFEVWTSVVVVSCFVPVFVFAIQNIEDYPFSALASAIDIMDSEVGDGAQKRDLKVYSGYDGGVGGYAELRGYRVYMDARGEVYLKANNGKDNILYEWSDFMSGKISRQELIEKYSFDYLLVQGENDPFYSLVDDDYEEIFSDQVTYLKLYKRIGDY